MTSKLQKFKKIQCSRSAEVIAREEIQLDAYDALHEVSTIDEKIVEHIVFCLNDVYELGDSDLEEMVRKGFDLPADIPLSVAHASTGYVYVCFSRR